MFDINEMTKTAFEPILFTPLQRAQKDGYVNITGVEGKRKIEYITSEKQVGYALKHVETARMLFYFQESDKCKSVPFDVSHLNDVSIVDSGEIKTSVKRHIENILVQARNGEI